MMCASSSIFSARCGRAQPSSATARSCAAHYGPHPQSPSFASLAPWEPTGGLLKQEPVANPERGVSGAVRAAARIPQMPLLSSPPLKRGGGVGEGANLKLARDKRAHCERIASASERRTAPPRRSLTARTRTRNGCNLRIGRTFRRRQQIFAPLRRAPGFPRTGACPFTPALDGERA